MNNEISVPVKLNINNEVIPINLEFSSAIPVTLEYGSGSALPYYTGDYEITPRKKEIVLPTKNKSMANDVTIFQIPYTSVANESGGQTVTIGIE